MRRSFLIATIAVLVSIAASAGHAQSVLDKIKQRGELRVAGVLYRPLISPRPNGEYVGADVEVMKLMAADLGVKLNILNSEWATAVAGIDADKWDIVPALCITDARKQVVDFSESYITIAPVFVSLADNSKGLNTVDAFNRPEVVFAVPSGSWSESVAKEGAPKATLKEFGQSTSAELIQEVVAGRADAVVMDTPIQITMALGVYGDKLHVFPGVDKPLDIKACHVGYAYKKGDTRMRDYIDTFMKKLRDSGKLGTIIKEYMTPAQIKAAG
jgi:polar amino acid transport system substrate-binding protein